MTGTRRVLVLAYYFPPLGGAGVQRTLKFVKYLPEFGWSATVVSTRSRLYPSRDTDLMREIPDGTRVVRAPALPVLRYAAIGLHKLGRMRLKACAATTCSMVSVSSGPPRRGKNTNGRRGCSEVGVASADNDVTAEMSRHPRGWLIVRLALPLVGQTAD